MLTQKYGTKNWSFISDFIEGRNSKQCRDRYSNYLIPVFFNCEWSKEEDELLKKLYRIFRPKWYKIQKSFQFRSQNSIKNLWLYYLCRQAEFNLAEKKNELIHS